MLIYESPAQVRSQTPIRQYLHTLLLTAIRDHAERLEIRFTETGSMIYIRVRGRDWELLPPPEDLEAELKTEIRKVSRLVSPERPDIVVAAGVGDARYEPSEVGWLTYQMSGYWLDLHVRIDPHEPWGGITFDLEGIDALTSTAAEALASIADEEASS